MPSKEQIHRIWAPPEVPWSRWVKPVLFAFMDGAFELRSPRTTGMDTGWLHPPGSAAIVVDLPCEDGVVWGMELAKQGYRPIPLYNALPFPVNEKMSPPQSRSKSTVDVEPILAALYLAASDLQHLPLSPAAPPAFLLDADRRLARIDPVPGTFDNRSVCFETDFPSAEFLLEHGIGSVLVVQKESDIAGDLARVLLCWQRRGIQILKKRVGDSTPPRPVIVKPPSILGRLWYRIGVALQLRREELGAFGAIVPSSTG